MAAEDGNAGVDRSEGDVNISPRRDRWRRERLDDGTRAILDEDERWFLRQALSTPCLDVVTGCEGSHLVTAAGRRILDFHGNSVHQVGFGHPAVIDAVKRQLDELSFCTRRYTNRTAIRLARELAESAPRGLEKVLLAPSGTVAVGMALKLARRATGRFKTISWWDSFHGASLDAISVGGEAIFRRGMGPLLPGAVHVPPPSSAAGSYGGSRTDALASADYVEYVMQREGDIGAFIAEPVRCTAVVEPPRAYWRRIRDLCDRHGALLVFDEIPLCLGRTGKLFASERTGVTPDILVLGKGLGGGVFPMAAVVAREELDVAPDTALGHYTYEKSPVGCAAALATLAVLREENLVERAARYGAKVLDSLRLRLGSHPLVGDVRGVGMLFAIEIARRENGAAVPAADEAEAILYAALRRGLSFRVSHGNILTLSPPLNVGEDEMDSALEILEESVAEVQREGEREGMPTR